MLVLVLECEADSPTTPKPWLPSSSQSRPLSQATERSIVEAAQRACLLAAPRVWVEGGDEQRWG